MFRIPKSRIVFFVLLSMMTAFAYHHWYMPRSLGQQNLSSSSPQDLSVQIKEILSVGGDIPGQLEALGAGGAKDAYKCQCTVEGIENPLLQLEEADSCSPERNSLEADLGKLDPLFREERSKSAAEFPRACLTYILRSTYQAAEAEKSDLFTTCKDATSEPLRGGQKPCVTKNYVNAIYNSFGDLTDCLGVPARDYLPKLAIESGFHMNVRGGKPETVKGADGVERRVMTGGDTGIPQFVTGTIDYANEDFARVQRQVQHSDRESCQRLAPYVKDLKPISSLVSQRCGLVLPPQNPLLSLFYMMVKYDQDSKAIERYMAKPENDILNRMKKLGLDDSKYDRAKLKQMLMILAYNSGPSATVTLLKNYLQAVALKKRTLELSDFDIGAESFIYRKINDKTSQLRKLESNTDADWARRRLEFETAAASLSQTNLRFKPTLKEVTVTEPVVGTYDTYKLEFDKGDLTFAAYSMLYQTSGNGGYLSKVRASAAALNTVFKEGVCVPDSYLAL